MTTVDEAPSDAPELGTTTDVILSKIASVRDGYSKGLLNDIDSRRAQLENLRRFLVDEDVVLSAALNADLGKSPIEAFTTEIGFVINEIDHTLKHLKSWTKPERVSLPIHFRPGSAKVVREPLGTVLIIAPWNYPLQLLLAPVVAAIAAGNTVVLKPSEVAPATAAVIAERLPKYVETSMIEVVLGGIPETTTLLAEQFDYIFYTGNGAVAKIVMRAAAEHLTPVTLELGGKSPAIVTPSADLAVSARRIAWGKLINTGQTCVAPDYVLVDERVRDEFLEHLQTAITDMYGENPSKSDDYGRIVNDRHFARLTGLLDSGGYDNMLVGGGNDAETRYFAPTVLTGVDVESPVMSEEIFGPILPIIEYSGIDEAIEFVNARPKPLALYVFTGRDTSADKVIDQTSSGGACVNHTLMHLAVPDFPFGGVGPSGMGSYHGEDGLKAFTHRKAVLRRGTKPDPSLAYPPYTAFKQKMLRKLL